MITLGSCLQKDAFAFSKPVNPVAAKCPDYFDVIKHPMDLGTMQKKFPGKGRVGEKKPEAKEYTTPYQFRDDMRLVWDNCRTYNTVGHAVRTMGDTLSEAWEKKWALSGIEAKWSEEMHRQELEDKVPVLTNVSTLYNAQVHRCRGSRLKSYTALLFSLFPNFPSAPARLPVGLQSRPASLVSYCSDLQSAHHLLLPCPSKTCSPDALLLQRILFTSRYSLGMAVETIVKSRLGRSCEICIIVLPILMVFQEISGGGDLAQEVQQLESALQQRLTASRATPEAEPNAMTFERKRRLSIALGQLSGDRVADVMRIISEDPYMREKVGAVVVPTFPPSLPMSSRLVRSKPPILWSTL